MMQVIKWWLAFAVIFPLVLIATLLRGEDPRRDRPWLPGGMY